MFDNFNDYLKYPTYSSHFSFEAPLRYFLTKDQIQKVKDISASIFAKIGAWVHTIETRNDAFDMKTVAMLSCLSIIGVAILIISMRKDRKDPPPASEPE